MTKAKRGRGRPRKSTVQNSKVENSLSQAIGVGNPFNFGLGFPQNQGFPGSVQLSQATTVFANLRWYLVSNFYQMLSEAYVEIGLIQTVCNVPVDDALRGGVDIFSKQLSPDQVDELLNSIDRDNDLVTLGQTAKWMRLYGGAGTLILTDQDPETPLDISSIGPDEPLEFRSADIWELTWSQQEAEGYNPAIQSSDFEFYDYYGSKIHKSRVMKMVGLPPPSFIRPRLRGWGFSVVETLIRSINQYLKSTDLMFEVLDEFKVDVFKIKNLVNTLMKPDGTQKVQERVQLANYQKNYQNALTMDSEDDWDHKQLSFAGLAETMQQIRMQVASDMRMPITKLFGVSASGFNSGEDDIEVYNAMVEGEVRNKLKYDILRVCEIKCQKLFGFIPDDLKISFKPLRVLSAEQEENVKTQKFTRLQMAAQSGLITPEEFREACNRDNLLPLNLETSEPLNPGGYMSDTIMEDDAPSDDPKDVDDPGADRAQSRKLRATDSNGVGKEPKAAKEPRESKIKEVKEPDMPKSADVKNSAQFDKASYEADGGDGWIDSRRVHFFDRSKAKNKPLWDKAMAASRAALGEYNWKFAVWYYKKHGGDDAVQNDIKKKV